MRKVLFVLVLLVAVVAMAGNSNVVSAQGAGECFTKVRIECFPNGPMANGMYCKGGWIVRHEHVYVDTTSVPSTNANTWCYQGEELRRAPVLATYHVTTPESPVWDPYYVFGGSWDPSWGNYSPYAVYGGPYENMPRRW